MVAVESIGLCSPPSPASTAGTREAAQPVWACPHAGCPAIGICGSSAGSAAGGSSWTLRGGTHPRVRWAAPPPWLPATAAPTPAHHPAGGPAAARARAEGGQAAGRGRHGRGDGPQQMHLHHPACASAQQAMEGVGLAKPEHNPTQHLDQCCNEDGKRHALPCCGRVLRWAAGAGMRRHGASSKLLGSWPRRRRRRGSCAGFSAPGATPTCGPCCRQA